MVGLIRLVLKDFNIEYKDNIGEDSPNKGGWRGGDFPQERILGGAFSYFLSHFIHAGRLRYVAFFSFSFIESIQIFKAFVTKGLFLTNYNFQVT